MATPNAQMTFDDTLQTNSLVWQTVLIPQELAPVFAPLLPGQGKFLFGSPRCITKPAGQLLFALNSVQDLSFPPALNFDVTFTGGTVLQQATPPFLPLVIQFDVNQVVQTNFALPGGPAVFIDKVTGAIIIWATNVSSSFWGTSCSGQPRRFDVACGWTSPDYPSVSPNPSINLSVAMSINGQQRVLALQLANVSMHFGGPVVVGVPEPVRIVPETLTTWWLIFLEHWRHGGPPPPPPWGEAMQDALLGLTTAEFGWAIHTRADGRRLQQAALDVVEAALARMRSTVGAAKE